MNSDIEKISFYSCLSARGLLRAGVDLFLNLLLPPLPLTGRAWLGTWVLVLGWWTGLDISMYDSLKRLLLGTFAN